MVIILVYVRLPFPYNADDPPDPCLMRFEAVLQSSGKRKHASNGEYTSGFLSNLFAHLAQWLDKGKRFRIVSNYAKVIIEHSDLACRIKEGYMSLRNANMKWVNRDNGEVQEVESIIACVNEWPIILSLTEFINNADVNLLDIGNYGVIWDEHVTRVSPMMQAFMDEESFRCGIAGDYVGDGLSVLCKLYNHYSKLCKANNFGEPSYTYASQGNGAYYGQSSPIEIRQTTDQRALSIEIESHFGGVRQAYGYGRYDGPCVLFDFSAFYPSIARRVEVPIKYKHLFDSIQVEQVAACLSKYYCIAKVDLRTPDGRYSLRGRFQTSYPTEDFTTYLHHCELERALSLGQIAKVHTLCCYERANILSNSISNLLSARSVCRARGDKLGEHYCKCIAVGWLGKLGSKLSCWEDCDNVIPPDNNGEWVMAIVGQTTLGRYRSINGRVQHKRDDLVPYLGSIAMAGAITAIGRDVISGVIDYAGRQNVLYVDTDGLICRGDAISRIDAFAQGATVQWGNLRRVVTANQCIIAGIGVYQIGDKQGQQGHMKGAEGGYDPATSPLPHSYSAVMHKASQVPFTFFKPHERSE